MEVPSGFAKTARVEITPNHIQVKYFTTISQKKVSRNYPSERKKRDYTKRSVCWNRIKQASSYQILPSYHVIVPVEIRYGENPIKVKDKILNSLRVLIHRKFKTTIYTEGSFHSTQHMKARLFHIHMVVYQLEGTSELEKDELLQALERIVGDKKITVISITSAAHAFNTIRYIYHPSKVATDIGNPFFRINFNLLKTKGVAYSKSNLQIPTHVAETFKKDFATYLEYRLGYTPFFKSTRAGFTWYSWIYQFDDAKKILVDSFKKHGLEPPQNLT